MYRSHPDYMINLGFTDMDYDVALVSHEFIYLRTTFQSIRYKIG